MRSSTHHRQFPPRRGSIALALLILVPVLFLLVVFGLHGIELRAVQTEMQNAADAAALAAACEMVGDELLCGDEDAIKERAKAAVLEAQRLAAANRVLGEPLELLDNPKNDKQRDVIFGRYDPETCAFYAVTDETWKNIDAVMILGRRTKERKTPAMLLNGPFFARSPHDLEVQSVAFLDRGVIGFRPIHGAVIPLMPIGLHENPLDPGKPVGCAGDNPGKGKGKGHEIGKGKGHDHHDHEDGPPFGKGTGKGHDHDGPAGDGCCEGPWTIRLGAADGNACLLQLGVENPEDLLRQVVEGIREADLKSLGGELVLNKDGRKRVPGACGEIDGDLTRVLGHMASAIRGQVRFWPLIGGMEHGQPVVTGFVAARIQSVKWEDGVLTLELRPTLASSPTVVVSSTRPDGPVLDRPNRYVCKVRLAK